jgi:hypothetical protein
MAKVVLVLVVDMLAEQDVKRVRSKTQIGADRVQIV